MSEVQGTSALKQGETFTIEQRNAWPGDERWELIGGVAYNMSPAPRPHHQIISGTLFHDLYDFLEGKPCEPFIAPVDVFLPEASSDNENTVVQPDVFVVCDPEKITDDGIHGAPDFIVEVLSDSTAYKDLTVKKQAYERSGVREYWIINPDTGSIFISILEQGRYLPMTEILKGERAYSKVLEGFNFTVR
jgi:Uma2 family endonuclease